MVRAHWKMTPKYLTDMKQILRIPVILLFVFSTSNTRQCEDKSIKSVVDGSVTIRNIGVKMCQLKCTEHGACLKYEYNIETLTCRLSRDESNKTGKMAGYKSLTKNHSSVPASPCASKTCSLGSRCLEARSGKAVCVQDGKLDYPKKSPPQRIDHREKLNNNPLHDACRKGDLEQVRRILAHSVTDVDSRSKEKRWTPLMVAAWKGHAVIFDFLIRQGANASLLDYYGYNILHWACTGGHVDMVEHVLKQCNVYINSRTQSGTTPLMKTVFNGHRNVFQFLVRLGANVSLVDDDGDNILHLAILGKNINMVKHILSRNIVNINSCGRHGRTPLMRAAYHGHRRMVDLLVSKGCRTYSVDNSGKTILHLASQNGRLKMVKHILSLNMTNINARDNDRNTAAMTAMSSGHCAVYDFLVLRGCPVI